LPCISSKMWPSRLAGLCLQLAGVKWRTGAGKGVEVEAAPGDVIMSEGQQMEEIWVNDPLEPDFFFNNQAGCVTPKAGKPLDIQDQRSPLIRPAMQTAGRHGELGIGII